jgi:hypothetical protein
VAKPDPAVWEWTGNRFRYIGGSQLGGRRHTVYVSERLVCQFEMDRRGIARVAVGAPLKAAVHSLVVQKAMPYAIRISPHGDTLEYLSSWNAVDTYEVIAGLRRVACRLFNGSGHAAAVEWVSKRGYGHGYHVLGQTLAFLNSTSPLGIEHAAKEAARGASWNPGLHPRGTKGRFVASNSAAALRRRAAAAARMRSSQ